jgi:hypothetical protein
MNAGRWHSRQQFAHGHLVGALFGCPFRRALTRAFGTGACGSPSASAVLPRLPSQLSEACAASGRVSSAAWPAKSLRLIPLLRTAACAYAVGHGDF